MGKLQSGDTLKPSKIGLFLPLGVLSMAVFGLWFIILSVPVIGLINKPDIVLRDLKNTSLEVYLIVGGTFLLVLLIQITLRIILKRKRIVIDDNYVYIKNIFFSKEIEIINVKAVEKISDKEAFCTNLVLIYNDNSKAKISGWLMNWGMMDELAEYIQNKNVKNK
jgi:hypothetical protein